MTNEKGETMEKRQSAASEGTESVSPIARAEQEIRRLQSLLAIREDTIRQLMQRLSHLEKPYWQVHKQLSQELVVCHERIGELIDEIQRIKATKTFRYTTTLRSIYGHLRRARPKPTE